MKRTKITYKSYNNCIRILSIENAATKVELINDDINVASIYLDTPPFYYKDCSLSETLFIYPKENGFFSLHENMTVSKELFLDAIRAMRQAGERYSEFKKHPPETKTIEI